MSLPLLPGDGKRTANDEADEAAVRVAAGRARDLQVEGGPNVGEVACRARMSSHVRESYPKRRATALRHR